MSSRLATTDPDYCPRCGCFAPFSVEIWKDKRPYLSEVVCTYCSRALASRLVREDSAEEAERE